MDNTISDPFEQILDLEDTFYQEGYDAGLADGEHAGLVEGKVFGIEKGYEKALELGRIHGRGLVWQSRLHPEQSAKSSSTPVDKDQSPEGILGQTLKSSKLPKNSRLVKHIEGLISIFEDKSTALDNSDDSVAEFDDRLSKAQARAKVIAAIVGEQWKSEVVNTNTGIEDAEGLNARH